MTLWKTIAKLNQAPKSFEFQSHLVSEYSFSDRKSKSLLQYICVHGSRELRAHQLLANSWSIVRKKASFLRRLRLSISEGGGSLIGSHKKLSVSLFVATCLVIHKGMKIIKEASSGGGSTGNNNYVGSRVTRWVCEKIAQKCCPTHFCKN
jgi:hypothetical protein